MAHWVVRLKPPNAFSTPTRLGQVKAHLEAQRLASPRGRTAPSGSHQRYQVKPEFTQTFASVPLAHLLRGPARISECPTNGNATS